MRKRKQISHNGLGLFLVGEKGIWGKVGELFLPRHSSACGPAPLPNQEPQLSKDLQGKDLFWWKLQLRPEGCEGAVWESKGQGNPLADQKPNPKPLTWPGSLWLGGPSPCHLPTDPIACPWLLLVAPSFVLGHWGQ